METAYFELNSVRAYTDEDKSVRPVPLPSVLNLLTSPILRPTRQTERTVSQRRRSAPCPLALEQQAGPLRALFRALRSSRFRRSRRSSEPSPSVLGPSSERCSWSIYLSYLVSSFVCFL